MRVVLNCGPVKGRAIQGHYAQILTGLHLLAREKRIDLRFGGSTTGIHLDVDGRRIAYDVLDGPDIDDDGLGRVDRLYKRSFHPRWVAASAYPDRIPPLGLNYEIHADGFNPLAAWHAKQCAPGRLAGLQALIRGAGISRHWRLTPSRLKALQRKGQLRVIFITRLWDHDHPGLDGTPDVNCLNSMRIRCVRALRKAFGSRAVAGCVPSALAESLCPELIDRQPVDRRSYLERVADCAIGVSTAGLFGSNPWKLAEFVALGRAIVSEPLHYPVPGFASGSHYLPFTTPDACCEQVQRLIDEPLLLQEITERMHVYDEQFLRPDRLVWATLQPDQN